jgi:hypothetical protein
MRRPDFRACGPFRFFEFLEQPPAFYLTVQAATDVNLYRWVNNLSGLSPSSNRGGDPAHPCPGHCVRKLLALPER